MLRQFASFFCAFIDVYHNFHSFPCFVKKILWSWKKFCDLVIFDFHRFSNTRSNPWFQVKFCLRQSVILNFRAASGIFKKRHFWCSFTQKYLKITQFLEKRHFSVKYYMGQCPTTGRWFLLDYSVSEQESFLREACESKSSSNMSKNFINDALVSFLFISRASYQLIFRRSLIN